MSTTINATIELSPRAISEWLENADELELIEAIERIGYIPRAELLAKIAYEEARKYNDGFKL